MLQGEAQVEFLSDPYGGEDVVRPVSMDLQGQFPPQHRQQGLFCHVVVRPRLLRLLPGVCLRLQERPPQQGGGGHTGLGAALLLGIDPLGILPQGGLHG